ncbi:MAG: type II toxin-antitoxin system PemK/MazF family toxin [Gemmatimonadota bacterium]|nr:type II toxin-antitoxin system PemK/MazF family toxin [Gemmatimonadota bacterium]
MVVQRGEVWWADLEDPRGSSSGYRRPVVVVQADAFNRSRLQTVVVVVLTSNLELLDAPGNVLIPRQYSALPKDSVANVSQVLTLDRDYLTELAARLPSRSMAAVDAGLRTVLDL